MIGNLVTRLFKNSGAAFSKTSPAETRLRRQLTTIVHGEQATVNRLVSHEKVRNPGHNEQWYLEKVLYDLRR